MDIFALRIYLQNHGPATPWRQLPAHLHPLFAGTAGDVARTDFFIADPAQEESHFVVTQLLAGKLRRLRADAIVLQNSELVILVRHSRKKTRRPEVTAISVASIETVGFRLCR